MKSAIKTHSSHFADKLNLRVEALEGMDTPNVLDAFSANGDLWRNVAKAHPCLVTRIEKEKGRKGIYLKGDNVKWMAAMDLTKFDVIDLDAYGSPLLNIEEVFKQRFKGTVIVTWIFGMAGTNRQIYEAIGISEQMVAMAPTMFADLSMDAVFSYLEKKGIQRLRMVKDTEKKKGFQRLYFSFKMPFL